MNDFDIQVNKGRPIALWTHKIGKQMMEDYVGIKGLKVDPYSGPVELKGNKDFILTTGLLEPFPNPCMKAENQRECWFMPSCSGSGKSTLASQIVRNYKTAFPDDKIYMFSSVGDDPAFEGLPITYVVMDDDFLEEALESGLRLQDYSDSMIIMDDIESIVNLDLRALIRDFRDRLFLTSRHERISIIYINHIMFDRDHTRLAHSESNFIAFFPSSGMGPNIRTYLHRYQGFDKKLIKKIMSLPSQWVVLHKTAPKYILYQTGAFLVK